MKRLFTPIRIITIGADGLFALHGFAAVLHDGDPVPDMFALAAMMLAGWIAKRGEARR